MVTFTKFGSCVTSDVFNFMNISNYYPKHIYTGINIATAVHKVHMAHPNGRVCGAKRPKCEAERSHHL